MRRVGRFRIASALGAFGACAWLALSACSNQGEGERCEFLNGNDDCKDGLICLPATPQPNAGLGVVNPPFNNSDRCCPLDRSQATHPACVIPTSPVSDAATPPLDTGPTPDVSVEAAPDVDAADAGEDVVDAADEG